MKSITRQPAKDWDSNPLVTVIRFRLMAVNASDMVNIQGTPLFFKGNMVHSIFMGKKTQTRRPHLDPGKIHNKIWVRQYRFQPKANAPAWLSVLSIHQEPLHAISPEDCISEGISVHSTDPVADFKKLWNSIYK